MEIRLIRPSDNKQVSELIKSVMTSFDCVGEGYSIEDEEVDAMSEAYANDNCVYYVIADEERIYGGAGIAPLAGGEPDTCELKKMYYYPEARGRGLGTKMMTLLLGDAKRLGFKNCYLETVGRMEAAQKLYVKFGFKKLEFQLGGTGHGGCDSFYIRPL